MIIVDGKFFKLVPHKSTNHTTVATCINCEPNIVEIRGNASSSSNFLSHLKRKHGVMLLNEYKRYALQKRITEEHAPSSIIKRPKRKTGEHLRCVLTQEQFETNIAKFVIHAMVPLQVVDDPYFTAIFEQLNIADYGLQTISRRTLGRKLDSMYIVTKKAVNDVLSEIVYVCTTADIWSGKTRSFLGVTVHWIDNNLNRRSAALACRRFRNSHTADNIAELLSQIHTEYNIDHTRICATVTDNGSNFVKAFKEYGVKEHSIDICETDILNEDMDTVNATDDDDDDVDSIHNNAIPQLPLLPKHIRCCAHTLNLIASSDLMKSIKSSENVLKMHTQIVKKCNILWKAVARPKSAEIVQNILGFTLPRPVETRWNSLYDALRKIVFIRSKCALLFQALKVRCMIADDEFIYIDEHLQCTKPIAEALDILQGETFSYYGIVLPTLVTVRRKLEKLNALDFHYCKPIVQKLLENVNRRFADFFTFSSETSLNAAIAAIAHPEFKNRWLACVSRECNDKVLTAFKDCVSAEIPRRHVTDNNITENCPTNFFDFGEEDVINSSHISEAEVQIANFFNDRRNMLHMLNTYEAIKAVFIKFNTPLPSSAPVERLFSYATMTNLPKSNRLSDEKFEQRIILRANLNLLP